MSAELAIQKAIYARLRSDSTLRGLLAEDLYEGSPTGAAVYDHVPQPDEAEDESLFPYVVIGDHTAIPFDTDDVNGQETTITLHVWDRRAGRARAKEIVVAIYASLHNAALSVEGQSTVFCYWEFGESIPDPDFMTQHEATRFRIVTQES